MIKGWTTDRGKGDRAGELTECPASAPSPLVDRLLRLAARAVYAEDRRLAFALDSSPRRDPARNHGLAYWVFEPTLVYEIFKAWLPVVGVEWEQAYPGQRAKKADLTVFDGDKEVAFEAKWWMSGAAKTGAAIVKDLKRVKPDGYLLTFWHSPDTDEDWRQDWADVEAFCQHNSAEAVYWACFPTRHNEGSRLFYVCALRPI